MKDRDALIAAVSRRLIQLHNGPPTRMRTPEGFAIEAVDTVLALTATRPAEGMVTLDYTNYRGERAARTITPWGVEWGSTDWHPEPGWLLTCYDHDKHAARTYALSGIHSWNGQPVSPPAGEGGLRDRLRELSQKATPGEWYADYDNDTGPEDGYLREFYKVASGEFSDPDDANLAAALVNAYRSAALRAASAEVETPRADAAWAKAVAENTAALRAASAEVEGAGVIYGEDGFPHTARTSLNWMDSAMQFSRNEDFYRGILERIGNLFGDAAKTSDDGSVQDSVLALKVPELVEAALRTAPSGKEREGWVLVPREPTEAMVQAGGEALPPTHRLSDCFAYFREAWAAALAASPEPSRQDGEQS